MNIKDKVKVVKLNEKKAMNLWGGYDDLTNLLGQTGTVTNVVSPNTDYERYSIEFDDVVAQITREREQGLFSLPNN